MKPRWTVAVVAGLLAVSLSGCSFRGAESLPLPGGPDLGDNPYEIKVEFSNVLDLVPHSVVKVNDVSVGEVTGIDLDGWHARVTCKIRRNVNLPDNAIATINQTSLLGEKFVALSAPSQEQAEGRLAQGDTIPLSRTSRTTEVEEVLSALSMLINGGGVEQIGTITHELNVALDGRTDTIKDVLNRVNTFVGTLDRHRDSIARAIESIDRLTAKLAADKKTIAQTIDRTEPAIRILNQNRADLTKMLVSLGEFGDTATLVINESRDDLLANLRALQPILNNLNKAGTDLPNGLEMLITYPFPPTASNMIRGDFANLDLTLDLNLQTLSENLLGGTAFEDLAKQQEKLRNLIRPPSLTLPQNPPGVLPPGGLPGLLGRSGGGQPGQPGGGGSGGGGGLLPPVGAPDPAAGNGLYTLVAGGLT